MRRRFFFTVVAIAAIAAGLLTGYAMKKDQDVKGYPGLGGQFTLQSAEGPLSLSDLAGKVVVLYFGYVSCPDACPMTMGKISAALQKMTPGQREQVRVVMISVDPDRDTVQMLHNYMGFFGEEFVGVTGSAEEIDRVARNYRVLYQKVDMPDSGLEYTVDHSSNTFVIGREGVVRFIVSHGSPYEEYRDRIVDAINGA